MSIYEISDIEDAFLDALAGLKTDGTVKTLESYGGQFDEGDIEHVTFRFPALYVIWSGSTLKTINRMDELHATVTVIAADRNLRGEKASRRGAHGMVGVYAILSSARALLHRQKILTDYTPALLTEERPIIFTRALAVYEAVYEMILRV